ncbi:uncharacterized protein LOC130565854 isoform X3 [Triplophysa rosa]|uniref:Uncharacterized protein n=1 Tax=Triplophysa rosa TaxID=992332 RepID=A0A9W7WHL8_TRIRA|nr:uncharacterized protein LOC130565854 isoform X3 [Triplophysa rosa]KAI7799395.1 hypothetical protein IRJ41_001940 [Triplophysa rosa]
MDTYGNIALILYYWSVITASSPSAQTSIRRGDEVSDHVDMSSSFSRDQTENTPHTLHTTAAQHPETTAVHPTSYATIHLTTQHPETTVRLTSPAAGITTSTQKSPPTSAAVIISSAAQAEARVDTPSALNVGDDVLDFYPRESSDPLLAGLVSAFVIIAAVVSVLMFLTFRNRNDGAEFSRLQDLPMDDMLEDAPLSTYDY